MRRSPATTVSLLAAAALAACSSSSDALQSAAPQPQSPASAQSTQTPAPALPGAASTPSGTPATQLSPPAMAAASAAATPAQIAAIAEKIRLQIAPIVGASVEAATPLTERLVARARARGIAIVGSTDTTATHLLKGYFSVLTEGSDTTVIYVWDVYDPAGNRLHRINGQQKTPALNGQQGWSAVPAAAMQAIADQTIDQLMSWLAGNAA